MKSAFIERSIKSALVFLKEAIFSEELAMSGGLLQSISPRIKLISFLFLIVTASFLRNIYGLVLLYVLSLILAVISGINIIFFLKRSWFFIPLFTLFIAMPAVFIKGLFPAAIFVLRVLVCVSLTVLVTITTKHSELLRSFRACGVPDIFVRVLGMLYRYIFLFIHIFEDMHLSLKARVIRDFSHSLARRWVASRISFFFKRSMKMSEEVYLAMLARGYREDAKR